jgi:hypothetical protein
MTLPAVKFSRGSGFQLNLVLLEPNAGGAAQHPLNLSNAVVRLTVRPSVGSQRVLLRVDGEVNSPLEGRTSFFIQPTDTSNIVPGIYPFEVWVGRPDALPFSVRAAGWEMWITDDLTKVIPPAVSSSLLATARARFIGIDGVPLQRVVLVAASTTFSVSGFVVPEATLSYQSDATGKIDIPMLRGAKVRVSIEGSGVIREFTVPDVEEFDLLEAMAAAPDMFTVQKLPPLITRRTL